MFPTPKTIKVINTNCDAAATVLRGYFISSFFHYLLKNFSVLGTVLDVKGFKTVKDRVLPSRREHLMRA